MNLDLAHQLSLIQRNLESAQLAIDNATELLNVVLGKTQIEHPALNSNIKPESLKRRTQRAKNKTKSAAKVEAQQETKPVKAKAPVEEPVLDDIDLDELVKPPRTALGIAAAVQEFVKSHSGTFTADDLVKWGRVHGYVFSRAQYASNLSYMVGKRGIGKYGVARTEAPGVFKVAA